jgi:hypothetical protein
MPGVMVDQQRSAVCYFAVRYWFSHQSWHYYNAFSTQAIFMILDKCVTDALRKLYYSIAKETYSKKFVLYAHTFLNACIYFCRFLNN